MWIFTQVGFFSVVCYDENRAPGNEAKFEDTAEGTDKKGKYSYSFFNFPKFTKAKKDPKVMIRSRVLEDLEDLLPYLPKGAEILHWRGHDYPYRVVVLQAAWAKAAAKLSGEIDYTNFKNRVKEKQGYARSGLYLNVWLAMSDAERKLKPEPKTKKNGKQSQISWGDYESSLYAEPLGQSYQPSSLSLLRSDTVEACEHNVSWHEPCEQCDSVVDLDVKECAEDVRNLQVATWAEADVEWLESLTPKELADAELNVEDVRAFRTEWDATGAEPTVEEVFADPFGVLENVGMAVTKKP